ncbi:pimeloyl-ACP methyl ester carboxylesterase [Motilibacter rhizosphaerae]|uniref:Pimeloyl-ACP methyl ester carboxylesterase n=1 Tax=Motilibacter rhizosphaerae TaxID=598652 RepID=A0A4Q7NUJ8_9ACTN|nr:alpha/beta fold hydrolase [Motilibacter rhizosphaerae]RZS90873.1 pimeloyl-ACP methyl ester carboxylesterase [Motilibacter rhizosphaerae]
MRAEERYVAAGPLRLWTERTGEPDLPAVLLVAGSAAQGISWPELLVARLVERGVQVLRFDQRDTGRSSTVDFAADPYTIEDMARDCLAVLDGWDLDSAAVAGASLGGMLAQWMGVHAPERVRSLTLVSTSPMGHDPRASRARARAGLPPDPDDLPPPAPEFLAHLAKGLPPGVESDVELFRVFTGPVRPYDEAAARDMLERSLARAGDPAAAANHHQAVWLDAPGLLAPLSSITAPTAVVHGDEDPVYPLRHGEALAAAIPGAVLHVVPGMGHVLTSPGLPEEVGDLILV